MAALKEALPPATTVWLMGATTMVGKILMPSVAEAMSMPAGLVMSSS